MMEASRDRYECVRYVPDTLPWGCVLRVTVTRTPELAFELLLAMLCHQLEPER
jgi:hypothetical protein